MKKRKYQQGVSLFEFILVIAIVGVITTIIMNQVNEYFKKEKNQQYGHQSIILAKAFSRYIIDHYKQYYDSSKINIQHIKYKELSDANYLPIGMKNQKNVYGYTPCTSIIYDKNLDIQAVMFFTASESSVKITFRDGADAMMAAGAAAGVIDTNKKQVYGAGRAWKIDNSTGNDYDSYFKTDECDYSKIPANSLVINLSLLSDYILQQKSESQNDTDKYLYRIPDDNCSVGKDCNRNTMKTDIIMNSKESDGTTKYHSINFGYGKTIDTGPILTSGKNEEDIRSRGVDALSNEVVLAGGGFAADTFRPNFSKRQRESCSLNELGTIVRESSADNPVLIRNQLLCSYSPVCPSTIESTTNYYCYLPMSDMTITYNLNNTPNTFSCPDGSYIDITTPFLVIIDGKIIDSRNDQVNPNFSDVLNLDNFVIYKSLAPTVYGRSAGIVSITCTSNPALIRK